MEVRVLRAGDPRLEPYHGLKDAALRSVGRWFILEGLTALRTVGSSGYELSSVLVLERRLEALRDLCLPADLPVYVVPEEVMAGTAGFDVHRGVLAAAVRPRTSSFDEILATVVPGAPLVIAEDINDQENLGSLFRNAAAFDVGAVLLSPACADPLYRRTVRVSLGLVSRVPFGRAGSWPDDLDEVRRRGYELVALTPATTAQPIAEVAAGTGNRPAALVVGAEGPGLSPGVLERCRQARIPMAPGVDSLNVAAATAVALFCFTGQV